MKDITIVSLGENCLVDEVLKDFKLRKETFPFGSGRFNIEYILSICKDNFENLLNTQHLRYAEVDGVKVVKNSFYSCQHQIYDASVCDDVEFTHHDPFQPKIRESLQRKIVRFQFALENPDKFVFIYYYRHSELRNKLTLISELEKWVGWVEKKSMRKPKVILIHQEIVSSSGDRGLTVQPHHWGLEVSMQTLEIWTGPELWSAPHDRDLFDKLLNANSTLKFMYGKEWFSEKKRRWIQKIKNQIDGFKFRIKESIKRILSPFH